MTRLCKHLLLFILQGLLWLPAGAAAPFAPPDLVECHGPELHGLFAIDHLVANARANDLEPVEMWTALAFLQHSGFPGLAMELRNFLSSSRRDPDQIRGYFYWQEAAFGFDPIPGEKFAKLLPTGCAAKLAIGHNVIRGLFATTANVFQYHAELRKKIQENSALQYSFVLLRTWLGRHTDDSALISRLNYLWHQKKYWENSPVTEEMQKLILQLSLSTKETKSSCERSLYAIESLSRALGIPCQAMTPHDLATLQQLEIRDSDRKVVYFDDYGLRKFDLAGLSALKTLSAKNVLWFGVVLLEGIFHELGSLEVLDLENTHIPALSRTQFLGLKNLRELNLDGIRTGKIEPGTFSGLFSRDPHVATTLKIGGDQSFSIVDREIFADLEQLQHLLIRRQVFLKKISRDAFRNLKTLRSLDLEESSQVRVEGGPLTQADLPRLTQLRLRGTDQFFRDLRTFESLRELDFSRNQNPVLLNEFTKFPNLQTLILEKSWIYFEDWDGRDIRHSLKALHKLEILKLSGAHLMSIRSSRDMLTSLIAEGLPQRLKTIEACVPAGEITVLSEAVRKAWLQNPQLVVKYRIDCTGEWQELRQKN